MSRKTAGIRQPHKLMFSTTPLTARYFRRHCFEEELEISYALDIALVDYLIKVGCIPSRESLEIQEQMEK